MLIVYTIMENLVNVQETKKRIKSEAITVSLFTDIMKFLGKLI